jgi:hypothetical protein
MVNHEVLKIAEGILEEISDETRDVKCWNLAVSSYTDWKKRVGNMFHKDERPTRWQAFLYDERAKCRENQDCTKTDILNQWNFVRRFINNYKKMFGKDACTTMQDIWNCLSETSFRAFSGTWVNQRAVAIAMAIDISQDKVGLLKGIAGRWAAIIFGFKTVIGVALYVSKMPGVSMPFKIIADGVIATKGSIANIIYKLLWRRRSTVKEGKDILEMIFEDPAPTDRFDPSRPCGKNSHTDPRGYDREKIVAIAKKYGIGTSKNKSMSQLCQEVREKHRALHPDKKKKKVRRRVN